MIGDAVSRSRPRGARLRAVGLAVAAVALLGACTHQRNVPDSYGDTTRDNFTEGCIEAMTSDDGEGERLSNEAATEVCECAYAAVSDPEDGVEFDDFKAMTEDLEEEPGPLPEPIAERVEACRPT